MTDRIIIEHKDGRRYSVTPAAHKAQYPDFKVIGPEKPEDFVATGIPKPKAIRKRPTPKSGRSLSSPQTPDAAPEANPGGVDPNAED